MKLELQTILKSKVKLRNIFQAPSVAEQFCSTHYIPAEVLTAISNEVIDIIVEHKGRKNAYKILEPGIGGGRFTLPFAAQMEKRSPGSRVYGLDNSQAMLAQLPDVLKRMKSFDYAHHDIALPLPFERDFFDASVSFYVYHCIKKWQQALDNVIDVLAEPRLLLFLREHSQWGYHLDNIFKGIEVSDKKYYKFWKEYFKLRQSVSPLPNVDISASDLAKLTAYLKTKGFKHRHKILDTRWERNIDYRAALESIESGLFTKLRVGLDRKQRLLLKNTMEKWLERNEIDPDLQNSKIPATIEIDTFYNEEEK